MTQFTPAQILEIQATGIDWYGEPLKVDGAWGPRTAWWAGILSLPEQRQKIVRTCLGYYKKGIKEDEGRPNQGEWVDRFNEPGRLGPAQPWCVAFTSYVLRECWFEEDVWPYHMSTKYLLEWAHGNGRMTKDPLPGDLACFMHDQDKGHTEFNLAISPLWTLDCGGNVGNQIQVGKRARDGILFVRTVDHEGSRLVMPPLEKMLNLDGTRTR